MLAFAWNTRPQQETYSKVNNFNLSLFKQKNNFLIYYRKDGRVCSFVKSSIGGTKRHSLQHRIFLHDSEIPFTSDKTLPRYVLDILTTEIARSSVSIKTSDYDTGSDEDSRASHKKSKVIAY